MKKMKIMGARALCALMLFGVCLSTKPMVGGSAQLINKEVALAALKAKPSAKWTLSEKIRCPQVFSRLKEVETMPTADLTMKQVEEFPALVNARITQEREALQNTTSPVAGQLSSLASTSGQKLSVSPSLPASDAGVEGGAGAALKEIAGGTKLEPSVSGGESKLRKFVRELTALNEERERKKAEEEMAKKLRDTPVSVLPGSQDLLENDSAHSKRNWPKIGGSCCLMLGAAVGVTAFAYWLYDKVWSKAADKRKRLTVLLQKAKAMRAGQPVEGESLTDGADKLRTAVCVNGANALEKKATEHLCNKLIPAFKANPKNDEAWKQLQVGIAMCRNELGMTVRLKGSWNSLFGSNKHVRFDLKNVKKYEPVS